MFVVVRSVTLHRWVCASEWLQMNFPASSCLFWTSTHLQREGEHCGRSGHNPAWTLFRTPSLPQCGWSKECPRLWRTERLVHHMMEHCSVAPAPEPPGRLRDSKSKFKPGVWRGETVKTYLTYPSWVFDIICMKWKLLLEYVWVYWVIKIQLQLRDVNYLLHLLQALWVVGQDLVAVS